MMLHGPWEPDALLWTESQGQSWRIWFPRIAYGVISHPPLPDSDIARCRAYHTLHRDSHSLSYFNLRLEAMSSMKIPLVPPVRTLISCTCLHLFLALWKCIIIVCQLPLLFNVPHCSLLGKVGLNSQKALVSISGHAHWSFKVWCWIGWNKIVHYFLFDFNYV